MAFGIDDIIGAGMQIINKFIPDPELRQKAEMELRNDLMKWDESQLKVNAVEAQHRSIFVAGWRPMIGWTCALALGYQYVLMPLTLWIAAMVGHPIPPGPTLDDMLYQLLFGMLGMAGLRTFEKLKGVTK